VCHSFAPASSSRWIPKYCLSSARRHLGPATHRPLVLFIDSWRSCKVLFFFLFFFLNKRRDLPFGERRKEGTYMSEKTQNFNIIIIVTLLLYYYFIVCSRPLLLCVIFYFFYSLSFLLKIFFPLFPLYNKIAEAYGIL